MLSNELRELLHGESSLTDKVKSIHGAIANVVKANLFVGSDAFFYLVIKSCINNNVNLRFSNKDGESIKLSMEDFNRFYLCDYLNEWIYLSPQDERYTLEDLLKCGLSSVDDDGDRLPLYILTNSLINISMGKRRVTSVH